MNDQQTPSAPPAQAPTGTYAPQPPQYYPQPPQPYPPQPPKKQPSKLGIAGFVIACVNLIVSFLSGFGIVLAILAFGLSLAGLIQKRKKKGLAVTGLVLAVLTFIFACAIGSGKGSSDTPKKSDSSATPPVTSVETVKPELTAEQFKAACVEADYKELMRNPEKHEGEKIRLQVKIAQVMNSGKSTTWRAYTDSGGYGWYSGDEYKLADCRTDDDMKVLDDDILIVYGEFAGATTIRRALTKVDEEVALVNVKYVELVEEE